MKRFVFSLAFLISLGQLFGQSITGLNFRDWYNPQNEVQLQLDLARGQNFLIVNYVLRTTKLPTDQYTIAWERRESYVAREGTSLSDRDSIPKMTSNERAGQMSFAIPDKPWILLARVTHIQSQKSWYYFKLMEGIYPKKGWIESNNGMLSENYLRAGREYVIKSCDAKPMHVSFYKTTSFIQSYPPFSDKAAPVERFLFHDSTFRLANNASFKLKREGLYLFQQDTTAADGFALRVVPENFPKYSKIEELAAPLVFVTTPDEFKQVAASLNDKPKFDKVILDITRDKERAKNFMRSYFRRVETANQYFSSFKEGWKMDRGMIYIIFGPPDELSKNAGNEVWNYRSMNVRFTFVKSGSVYDPDNYVLLRDKRFMEPWFSTIDLWRKSRF